MKHILDNPIWWALHNDFKHLGQGSDQVKIFHPEVAPFAAVSADTTENFQGLYERLQNEQVVVMFSPKQDLDPSPLNIVANIPGIQMVFEGQVETSESLHEIVDLREAQIPKMLELTQIAQPGPFSKRTIEFGGYSGLYDGERLVAMAGERLRTGHYTEISAVCTHPDYAGKGFARKLVMHTVAQITAKGQTPYLHVKSDNTRAIELYQKLGFVKRSDMNFYVLSR